MRLVQWLPHTGGQKSILHVRNGSTSHIKAPYKYYEICLNTWGPWMPQLMDVFFVTTRVPFHCLWCPLCYSYIVELELTIVIQSYAPMVQDDQLKKKKYDFHLIVRWIRDIHGVITYRKQSSHWLATIWTFYLCYSFHRFVSTWTETLYIYCKLFGRLALTIKI